MPKFQETTYHMLLNDDDDLQHSITESDAFLHHKEKRKSYGLLEILRNQKLAVLGVIFALTAYTLLIVVLASIWWSKERLHGASVVHSPIRKNILYEATMLGHDEKSPAQGLIGRPSDEIDASWSELMDYFFAEVPYNYMASLNRLGSGVRLPNGNFAATYTFMHDLHCLKRIYQSYYPDRYFPNMTQEEELFQEEHNLHCLEMLIHSVMCKPDETPMTLVWLEDSELPVPNHSPIAHECVNWSFLLEGLENDLIDPFAEGVFVHPKFGPAAPDGRASVLKDRIGVTHETKLLDDDSSSHQHSG